MAETYRSRSDLSREPFDRILLVKPSSLGDVIHALPVLHGLRARYPNAKIDWLIASSNAPLLEHHEEIDELVVFDRRRFGRVGRSASATSEFVSFVRELRTRRYDLVIDLQGLFRTGFLTLASGARVRIGFRDAREGAWTFYTHYIQPGEPDTHAVDRNYRVARLLGFEDVPIEFTLSLTEAMRAEARDLLHEFGVSEDVCLVAVAPWARWETKRWAPERFAETIDRLSVRSDTSFVLLASPNEIAQCERIGRACRKAPANLAGRTNLATLAAIIERADVVLCHDSAALHLAVAFERPLVCLMGPTNPHRTGPYRRPADVVQLKLHCSPCYFRRLTQCPHDHRCMAELDVDAVVSAAMGLLPEMAPKSA